MVDENKMENSTEKNTKNGFNSDSKNENDTNKQAEANNTETVETPADPTFELKQQIEKWKNDFLYLRAEFDTYKRNAIKERADISKYGSERLVTDILTVVDNFDRALSTKITPDTIEVYAQGVKMTSDELKSVLSRFGVTEIKCEGSPFDPNLHEALGAEESEAVAEGHILRVFRNAYKLHDRVIRPAQVIVAKAPSAKN